MAERHKIVISPPRHDLSGARFSVYAERYAAAGDTLLNMPRTSSLFDPVLYHVSCQALELNLKSFIWLKKRPPASHYKNKYGHKLAKLWEEAVELGLGRYARITACRETAIANVAEHYANRKFAYATPYFALTGAGGLREDIKTVRTIQRLNRRLNPLLRPEILRAS